MERAVEVNGEATRSGPTHAFPLDLHEVSHLGLNHVRDAIVINAWTPARGVWTVERR